MKDNFQDSLYDLLTKHAPEDSMDSGMVDPMYESQMDTIAKDFTQLFKDYIEAHCPESMPLVIMGRQDYSEYPIAETAYKYALQQYKSNLLEGLSDE